MSSKGKSYPIDAHSDSPYVQDNVVGLVSKLSWRARKRMFTSLMRLAQPIEATIVLDVGVTSDRREDSNFFEKLYPYPQKITAVGLEEADFLEQDFPGLTYVKANGLDLPFPDQAFDLVVSFAVIEHVGSRKNQQAFVKELCRVGRTCCITTPNRWYPIELHSLVPFLHWLPLPWFRQILKWIGKEFWAQEENLNPLSERELLELLPNNLKIYKKHHRLFGLVSNLLVYVEN